MIIVDFISQIAFQCSCPYPTFSAEIPMQKYYPQALYKIIDLCDQYIWQRIDRFQSILRNCFQDNTSFALAMLDYASFSDVAPKLCHGNTSSAYATAEPRCLKVPQWLHDHFLFHIFGLLLFPSPSIIFRAYLRFF